MLIGYARISTTEQNLDLQRDALKAVGCDKIVEDTASGGKTHRSGLDRALELLRKGDTLVVWRLDRLGRSLRHLIELVTELEGRGIGFRSLQEAIDTTSPGGTLVFHIFGALAEFERNLIRERTRAGLEAARVRGRKGGRRHKLDARKRALAVELYRGRKHTVVEICEMVGITKPTLYAYIREAGPAVYRGDETRTAEDVPAEDIQVADVPIEEPPVEDIPDPSHKPTRPLVGNPPPTPSGPKARPKRAK